MIMGLIGAVTALVAVMFFNNDKKVVIKSQSGMHLEMDLSKGTCSPK